MSNDHPVPSRDDEPSWAEVSVTQVLIDDRADPPAERAPGHLRTPAHRRPSPPAWRPSSRQIDIGIFVAAGVGAAVLRLFGLNAVGLNSDEAVYAGQAASLAGNEHTVDFFPVIRAHPLLLQMLMSVYMGRGVHDLSGRLLVVAFGLATVVLVGALGWVLYGRRTGAVAALLFAVCPYHVVVSRQILLDAPMTLFLTAALLCVAKFGLTRDRRWMVGAGLGVGLAVLTKETAVIYVAAVYSFFALVPRYSRPMSNWLPGAVIALAMTILYPVATALVGGGRSGKSYLTWQLTRRPNHSFDFYFTAVAPALGLLVLLCAACGLWLLRRHGSWREVLLLCWVVPPLLFFELWPVKGFQYLLPQAVPLVVLAARGLTCVEVPLRGRAAQDRLRAAVVTAVVVSLLVPSWRAVGQAGQSGLAGSGGTPGGREAGEWAARHTAEGARFMTVGPSMANILQYYGGRSAAGLSVSPNPLHRNPSYVPILNPDAALRGGDFQYVVWDAYSARRSPFFAQRTLALAQRYGGREVHVEHSTDGDPVIRIYQVYP